MKTSLEMPGITYDLLTISFRRIQICPVFFVTVKRRHRVVDTAGQHRISIFILGMIPLILKGLPAKLSREFAQKKPQKVVDSSTLSIGV